MRDHIAKWLLEIGFSKQATQKVWLDLEERYRAGWSLLHQRRSAAEIEALQANADGGEQEGRCPQPSVCQMARGKRRSHHPDRSPPTTP